MIDRSSDRKLSPNRIYVLFMLVLVYTFNFLDRQIIGILAVPIKADLALSDTQLGLMGGLAFALFYTALGIPVAILADRHSRTWIMTGALTLWSAMTAVCGLAQGFWQLFAARLGVGIGEAGGVAPAHSLISDYFPPHQRARALGVYSFGIPIGSALAMFFGGWIASTLDWRYAFFVVGIAGVILAPIFRLTVAEPVRGRLDANTQTTIAPALPDILRALLAKPSFWLISFGTASSSMIGYSLFFWLPSVLVRSYDLTLLDASLYMGALTLVGGTIGIWLGGWAADRFGRADRAVFALIPAAAFVLTIPFYAFGLFAPSAVLAFVVLLVPMALGLAWLGPVLSAVQHLVQPGMRATAAAVHLFIVNLVGLGAGSVLLGALSDTLLVRYGDDSLRYAILAGMSLYLVAAVLFLFSTRWLADDWEEPEHGVSWGALRAP
jgi:MFS family permease